MPGTSKKQTSLARTASLYGISNAIYSAVPILFVPLLTRVLTEGDYGTLANFIVLVDFVSPLVSLSVHAAILRQFYDQETVDLPRYVGNCLLVVLVSTAIVSGLLLLFAKLLSGATALPPHVIWTVVLVCAGNALINIILALWRAETKPIAFGVFRILQSAFNMGLTVILVLYVDRSWRGRVDAEIWTFVLFGATALFLMWRRGDIKWAWDKVYFIDALKYGGPLIPHDLGVVVRTMSDRLFITAMVGIDTTGLYAVGYQVGRLIGFVETSFNMAWVPWLFERLKKGKLADKVRIVRYTYVYMVAILGAALLLALAAPGFMSFFVGEKFEGSHIYVIWIALGFAFNGMYKMVTNYLFYIKKTGHLSAVTVTTAVLHLGLNYVMIKNYGAIGAAQATTITLLLSFVLTWIVAQRVYPMPWRYWRVKLDEAGEEEGGA